MVDYGSSAFNKDAGSWASIPSSWLVDVGSSSAMDRTPCDNGWKAINIPMLGTICVPSPNIGKEMAMDRLSCNSGWQKVNIPMFGWVCVPLPGY